MADLMTPPELIRNVIRENVIYNYDINISRDFFIANSEKKSKREIFLIRRDIIESLADGIKRQAQKMASSEDDLSSIKVTTGMVMSEDTDVMLMMSFTEKPMLDMAKKAIKNLKAHYAEVLSFFEISRSKNENGNILNYEHEILPLLDRIDMAKKIKDETGKLNANNLNKVSRHYKI